MNAGQPHDDPRDHATRLGLRPLLALIAVLGVVRVVAAFFQTDRDNAFGHDPSYLWIVARNVLLGNGFVNDAHWLVFLDPDTLPIPYHNAQPLFSFLTATLARTGLDVTTAGYVVNAVGGVALVFAVAWLLRAFQVTWAPALAVGLVVSLFQPVGSLTFIYGTNALTMLFATLCFAAALSEVRFSAVWTGVFFGLAWLSRGDAILILPALGLALWVRHGLLDAVKRLVVVGAAAAVVASPWLVHQWSVWGSPMRSDSSYYLVQDYLAIKVRGITVWQYWHSPIVPEGLLSAVSADPVGFTLHTLEGVPRVILHTLSDWAVLSPFVALVLAVLGGAGVVVLWRTHRWALMVFAVLGATHTALWAIRSLTYETRYFSILAILFAVICCAGFVDLAGRLRRSRWPSAGPALLAAATAVAVLVPTVQSTLSLFGPNPELLEHEAFYRSVDALAEGDGPVVVGDKPYYFTQMTLRSSLSIPYADDDYLRSYMEKYGARYVALTDEELESWHPEWRDPSGLPDFLEPVPEEHGHVFRLVDGA